MGLGTGESFRMSGQVWMHPLLTVLAQSSPRAILEHPLPLLGLASVQGSQGPRPDYIPPGSAGEQEADCGHASHCSDPEG